jgi:hypothetical protein
MKTKHCILIVLALAAFDAPGKAQVAFGPALGVNFANVTGDGSGDNAMKIGIHAGALAEIGISSNFSRECCIP